MLIAIMLAGGSGSRLWPLSRRNFPKQFLRLNGDRSLLQQAVERTSMAVPTENIIVVTGEDYRFHVSSELVDYSVNHILYEPVSRNTGPAILLAVKYAVEKMGAKGNDVLFVSPCDHVIRPLERFVEYIKRAEHLAASGYLVTFGVSPTRPETGYGYIKTTGELISDGGIRVERFVEKPDEDTAAHYLKEGGYYWNSGMFAFSIEKIIGEFQTNASELARYLSKTYDEIVRDFQLIKAISIDYAVMERSSSVLTLPLDIYWNDVGSWDSLFDILEKDKDGNVTSGNVLNLDTVDSMVIGEKRLITTIGLSDLLIVETGDAILISKRGNSQRVRELVTLLKKENKKEESDHLTTYRPWGSYTILEEGSRYKIKRIVVSPGAKLSMQMHHHRSEHWVVVTGTAKVTIGEREIYVHENESAYVPKSTYHRLENPGRIPLEMIEVQNGEYAGEDDIIRFDDIYGRK